MDTESYFSLLEDKKLTDCTSKVFCIANHKKNTKAKTQEVKQSYINLPEDMIEDNPLDMQNIKEKQDADAQLQEAALKYASCYSRNSLGMV